MERRVQKFTAWVLTLSLVLITALLPAQESYAGVVGRSAGSKAAEITAAVGIHGGMAGSGSVGVVVEDAAVSADAAARGTSVAKQSGAAAGSTAAQGASAAVQSGAAPEAQAGAAPEAQNTAASAQASDAAAREAEATIAATQSIGEGSAAVNAGSAQSTEPKVVTRSFFSGGEILLLASQTISQMMSFIVTTKSGKLIVIDGGLPEDAPHLKEMLLKKGGHVSAWLISHPHSDHVGAITEILNEENSGITIEGIYYNFEPIEWYHANEEYRADMVEKCMAALGTVSPSVNHPRVHKGEVIQIDDARITVMNDPYLFQTNAINNSSVAYRLEMGGKRILFLGDMGVQAGNSLLNEYRDNLEELRADAVQMAHHGQGGVDRKVYEAIKATVCLWCCPAWLWNNDNGGGTNSGDWKTLEVRSWMRQLGAKTHVVAKDGDQVMR